jgi:hypothetical protein
MGRRIPAMQYCFEYMDENAAKTMKNEKGGQIARLAAVDP